MKVIDNRNTIINFFNVRPVFFYVQNVITLFFQENYVNELLPNFSSLIIVHAGRRKLTVKIISFYGKSHTTL